MVRRVERTAATILACFAFVSASAASADADPRPFDRPFGLAIEGVGWAGDYAAAGGGARARWEPFERLGVEVFAQSLIVENDGGMRHDHPVGFNAYVPFDLSEAIRLRPLFGFCAVISMIDPEERGAPRADDVLFGVHGGAGIEIGFASEWSFFIDVQGIAWLGHTRSAQGWTGSVDGDYTTYGVVEATAGLQLHLGEP